MREERVDEPDEAGTAHQRAEDAGGEVGGLDAGGARRVLRVLVRVRLPGIAGHREVPGPLEAAPVDDHQALDQVGASDRQPGRDVAADRVADQDGTVGGELFEQFLDALGQARLGDRRGGGGGVAVSGPVHADAVQSGREQGADLVVVALDVAAAGQQEDGVALAAGVVGEGSGGGRQSTHAPSVAL